MSCTSDSTLGQSESRGSSKEFKSHPSRQIISHGLTFLVASGIGRRNVEGAHKDVHMNPLTSIGSGNHEKLNNCLFFSKLLKAKLNLSENQPRVFIEREELCCPQVSSFVSKNSSTARLTDGKEAET